MQYNFKHIITGILALATVAFIPNNLNAQDRKIDISGTWKVSLDSLDNGFASQPFSNTINLPGTLNSAGLGIESTMKPEMTKEVMANLIPKFTYVGAAWYQREIEIPANWKNSEITLKLERALWETRVWVDGKEKGMQEGISSAQYFVLNNMKPGKHTITLRIDNRRKYNLNDNDMAHAYTYATQIKWNGVLGEMSLMALEPVRVTDVQVFPDINNNQILVRAQVLNSSAKTYKGNWIASVEHAKSLKKLPDLPFSCEVPANVTKQIELKYDMGRGAELWDEFTPSTYRLKISQATSKKELQPLASEVFGMCRLAAENRLLTINNHRLFLRGTLECAIFPLTGCPPMTKEGWRYIFDAAKSYGLNHLRFHSWCPPKAAFEVADDYGFYLQVELPNWSSKVGKDTAASNFWKREAAAILKEYGNHPSFCFMSMGNELEGDYDYLNNLVNTLKKQDLRHLYSTTTFTFQQGHGRSPEESDDFFITQYTKKGWVRGQGIFDQVSPSFDKDYSFSVDDFPQPLISHEIGQYSVYPDLSEIDKYTGVLQPLNFIAIQKDLQQKGLLNMAKDYTDATGKFALLLYKEEIERALKTPGFSGFQLLDLHDFPGQSTALVGILNPFWESKGFTTPDEHRRWCSEVVPMIRYPKAVYTNNETFDASLEVANFWKPLKDVVLDVEIYNGSEKLYHTEIKATEINIGNAHKIGAISYPLSGIEKASKLKVSIGIKGTAYRNDWDIFVYPGKVNYPAVNYTGGVFVTRSFSEAEAWLKEGKTVLLNPPLNAINGITGKFVPVFWSPVHFPNQPGTMGILCNPSHPALKDFPTDYHSNWQWWDLNINSKVVNTDTLGGQPIVRVIDNFFKNRSLSVLLEGKVGNGKLLFCSIDLEKDIDNRPAARQLMLSLLNYMNSSAFNPTSTIDLERMEHIMISKHNSGSKILDCSSYDSSYPPEAAMDGDKNTFWHTAWGQDLKKHPHHIAIELAKETEIAGFVYVPRQDNNSNGFIAQYEFYVGKDAQNWGTPFAAGSFEWGMNPQIVRFNAPIKTKYIKFKALKGFSNEPFASIAELELIYANN